MLGHDGQMVAMIPSKDLVIVRLGLSRKPEAFDNAALVRSITAAFE
jgi:CubicO group peptidase (beta-lactamase class C family)